LPVIIVEKLPSSVDTESVAYRVDTLASKAKLLSAKRVLAYMSCVEMLPICAESDEISAAAIILLAFILTVEIAGSSAQSDSDDILEVVATGIPFSSSSEPAVVSKAPSRNIPSVLILLITALSTSRYVVLMLKLTTSRAVRVLVTNILSKVETVPPLPSTVRRV
jgi:hypothetical protein